MAQQHAPKRRARSDARVSVDRLQQLEKRIKIKQLTEGSVIVHFEILPASSDLLLDESGPEQTAETQQSTFVYDWAPVERIVECMQQIWTDSRVGSSAAAPTAGASIAKPEEWMRRIKSDIEPVVTWTPHELEADLTREAADTDEANVKERAAEVGGAQPSVLTPEPVVDDSAAPFGQQSSVSDVLEEGLHRVPGAENTRKEWNEYA